MNVKLVVGLSSLTSLLAGAAAGYFAAQKRLGAAYDARVIEEIEATKVYYKANSATEKFDTPAEAVEALIEDPREELKAVVARLNYSLPQVVAEAPARVDDGSKTIVVADAFLNPEAPFQAVTLSYYEGDDCLVDDETQEEVDIDETVGIGNLRFGYRSGDPTAVYVKNENRRVIYEITKCPGRFDGNVPDEDDEE